MKRLHLLYLIILFAGVRVACQSEADSGMYKAGIDILDKARTTENYLEAAFYFEHVASEYPKQWLACYYVALSYIQASQKALASNYKDQLTDKAQPFIDKAFLLKPGEPEIQILQAFLYQTRLQVNPQSRGLAYSQKAEASLKKAMAGDPDNPRAYFLMGCNIYYTPVMLRGGPKNALPMFIKARDKFRSYDPVLTFMPEWGEKENRGMIISCSNSKN